MRVKRTVHTLEQNRRFGKLCHVQSSLELCRLPAEVPVDATTARFRTSELLSISNFYLYAMFSLESKTTRKTIRRWTIAFVKVFILYCLQFCLTTTSRWASVAVIATPPRQNPSTSIFNRSEICHLGLMWLKLSAESAEEKLFTPSL